MYGKAEENIERAFLQLYRQKEISAITVKEICQIAGTSRATFYIYYTDVQGLLNEIEERTIFDVSEILKSWKYLDLKNMDSSVPLPMYLETYTYVYKHREAFRSLFGPYGNHRFILRYNDMIYRDYLEKIVIDKVKTVNPEMLAAFCAGSIIYSSVVWFNDMSASTPKEMAAMATKAVLSIVYRAHKNWEAVNGGGDRRGYSPDIPGTGLA